MRISLTLILILSGCAKAQQADTSEFSREIEMLKVEGETRGVLVVADSLEIRIEEYVGDSGICYKHADGSSTVKLNKIWFEAFRENRAARELLLFHELGHCLLGKGHDGPNTIMSGGTPPQWQEYEKNRGYYLDQYFGRTQ